MTNFVRRHSYLNPEASQTNSGNEEPFQTGMNEGVMSKTRPDHFEAGLPTQEILRRLAEELDALSGQIGKVERALPSLLGNKSRPVAAETLVALQELDLIAQTTAALSGFLRAAKPLQPEAPIHIGAALLSLKLFDLSSRLGGGYRAQVDEVSFGCGNQGTLPNKNERPSGDVELF